jgi:hypothetical protein
LYDSVHQRRNALSTARRGTADDCSDDGDNDSGFGGPMSPADPGTQIGVYNPPSSDVPPPPNMPPLGNPNNPPIGSPDAPPFTESGPFPDYYTPLYTFTTTLIDFYNGTPSYGTIAPGSISDISLGLSTAGSGSVPAIPGAGHLYVQL